MVGVLIALVAAMVIMGGVALNEYMSNENQQPSEVRPHVQYVYDPPVNSEDPSAPTTEVASSDPASPVSTAEVTTYTTTDGTIITVQRPPCAPVSVDGQQVSTTAVDASAPAVDETASAQEVSEATDRPGAEESASGAAAGTDVASGEVASPMPDSNL
jgi:cytoskeletal protein RodZ